MRVLVCGGRDYADRDRVFDTLDRIHAETRISLLIHGACRQDADRPRRLDAYRGADRWAHDWAIGNWVAVCAMPARWSALGRAAGPIRNREMLTKLHMAGSEAKLVVAFPGGRGTANMVAIARRAGVRVLEVA